MDEPKRFSDMTQEEFEEYRALIKDKVGEGLRRRREELGWTQAKTAEFFDITAPAYSHWELGRHTPDTKRLVKIWDFLRNDPDGDEPTDPELQEYLRTRNVELVQSRHDHQWWTMQIGRRKPLVAETAPTPRAAALAYFRQQSALEAAALELAIAVDDGWPVRMSTGTDADE